MDLRYRSAPTDQLLNLAMVITLVCYLVVIYQGYKLNIQRKHEASLRSLDLGVNEARKELDNFFSAMNKTLDEVVVRSTEQDTSIEQTFVQNMLPILRNNKNIHSIAVADAAGNELALSSEKGTYHLRRTELGSLDTMPQVVDLHVGIRSGFNPGDTTYLNHALDPRSRPWFAHALNDHRGTARWLGPRSSGMDRNDIMVAAMPIRDPLKKQKVRVAMMEVQLTELLQALLYRPTGRNASMFIVSSEQVLLRNNSATAQNDSLTELANESIRTWIKGQTAAPLPFEWRNNAFSTRVIPYTLNGYDLYVGATVRTARNGAWTPEHTLMLLSGLVMITFALLFFWSSNRKRRDLRRILMQEERSRSTHEKLQQALGEREVLDREVHHRVKNNLQIMTSLINLQSRSLPEDNSALKEFKRAQRRIGAMATVHMKLYGLQDLRGVDLQPFLEGLVFEIKKDHDGNSTRNSYAVETNKIKLDLDTSIDLGMAVHELVSNCFEHAFPFATGGHVDLVVEKLSATKYQLTVSDNGVGMKKNISRSGRIGLEVLQLIAEKFDGTFEQTVANGTVSTLRLIVTEQTSTILRP